jgi:hypothetical protein
MHYVRAFEEMALKSFDGNDPFSTHSMKKLASVLQV